MAAVAEVRHEIRKANLPSQFIETIIDTWKNTGADGQHRSFSSALAHGLILAGIPHRGHEVVHIHACLLDSLLQIRGTATDKGFSTTASRVSWSEYFQLLADRKLQWVDLVQPMLPLMPLPVACSYMKNLVECLETSLLQASAVTEGNICLCIAGCELGLNALLDLLLRTDCPENEHVGAAQATDLQSLMMLAKRCLDILLHALSLESGLEACLASVGTSRAVTQSLWLTLFISCPILPLKETAAQLKRFVFKSQNRTSNEEHSSEEKEQIQSKTAKHRRGEDERRREDMWLPDSVCTRIEINKNCPTTAVKSEVGKKVLGESVCDLAEESSADESLSENPKSIEYLCNKLLSEFKSECLSSLLEKIVSFFCRGSDAGSETFFDALANVASNPEPICVGHHHFSQLVLQEQFLPLLWYLTSEDNEPYPIHCDLPRVRDLLSLLDKHWQAGGSYAESQEVVTRMRQGGKAIPEQLLCLHLSEAERILASGRSLCGDSDLAQLRRLVETKDRGWRDLMSLGMRSKDFQDWWNNGFFQLVWAAEASLATEDNVIQVIQNLSLAAHNHKEGACDKIVVNNIKKLVSVMFQRLPTVLKEQVVLCFVKHAPGYPVLSGERPPCGQLLSEVMTQDQVTNELTFILNRLTLENAEQQTSFLLYLCVFHTGTVIRHLARAAISSNVQTAPVVKVLHSMSLICRHHRVEDKNCLLVSCIEEEISKLDVENDKQVQIIANFLFTITEPFAMTPEDGSTPRELKTDGILSLREVLHSFVFPSFGCKETSLESSEALNFVENDSHLIQNKHSMENLNKSSKELNIECVAKSAEGEIHIQQSGQMAYENKLQMSYSLGMALASLELFLEKAVKEDAFPVSEFQPFQLIVSLCDCYSRNYSLLVEGPPQDEASTQLCVCPRRKAARLASHRCLSSLLQLVKSTWASLPESEKAWLFEIVSERCWLCAALLAPVLVHCEGWNDIFQVSLGELAAKEDLGIKALVHLLQLAAVNDIMFETICDKLSMLSSHLTYDNVLVALKWVLSTAVPDEMSRIVQTVKLLLRTGVRENQLEQHMLEAQCYNQLEDKESVLCVRLGQTLVDSAFLLVTDRTNDSLICHSLMNYQAALQSVLGTASQAVLINILSQHCSLLVLTNGQAAEILQVTALDILSRLKSAVTERKKQRRSGRAGGVKVGGRMRENRELEESLSSVSDWIACVEDADVSLVLSNQLREVTV